MIAVCATCGAEKTLGSCRSKPTYSYCLPCQRERMRQWKRKRNVEPVAVSVAGARERLAVFLDECWTEPVKNRLAKLLRSGRGRTSDKTPKPIDREDARQRGVEGT